MSSAHVQTTTIEIDAVSPQLSFWADEAAHGRTVIMARNGTPVAKLTAVRPFTPKRGLIGCGQHHAVGAAPRTVEEFNAGDDRIAVLFGVPG